MRILIVDDKKENLYLLDFLLKGNGYEVETANNGAQALEKLHVKNFDLIVSDILMPVMDGFQLCRNVKKEEQLKAIPLVFYTATYTDEKDEEFALGLGADRFIRKPKEPDEFMKIIKGIVSDRKQGKVISKPPDSQDEKEVFQLYSERLVMKLEKKMLDLEKEITERKHAEERQAEFGRILETSLNELYVFDGETLRLILVNKGARENLGYSMEELRCLSLPNLLEEVSPGPLREQLEALRIGNQHRVQFISAHRRKDGTTYPVEMHLECSTFESSPVFVGIVLDITERQKAEEALNQAETQLRQAQKMEVMGVLAGGIAHDFNNILSAILVYADLSMHLVQKESRIYSNLQEVLAAGKRAKDLVRQVLAFSRQSEQGQRPIQLRPIIQEALSLLRASLPATIEVQQHYNTESDVILADPTQIHQVMMNLCTNAYHAMRKKGGILKIRLESIEVTSEVAASQLHQNPGAYVRITVADTGLGMASEVREQIFKPYFTTKEESGGTGLGLAIGHSIITKYGGVIRVESAPEQGTVFEIDLPHLDVPAAVETPSEDSIPGGSGHILFVDDEEVLAFLWKQALEDLGYTVEVRTSSVEALEVFRNAPDAFHAVITDMTMPHMTGEVLAREVLQIRPNIPIILCTSFDQSSESMKGQATGIKTCLRKPLLIRDLAIALHQVLGQKHGGNV
ncbi:response regulator [Candidatus Nitrospira neomarina]|uniref:histidine kinase n=1 Tax=Candidatus Nitrospira neomarina TaxID=3020899 RepID=A0AA96GFF9_9BACT|nr:response regulator [Candidatus Nitrospira neomarina]WNM61329.1 response regulator [Candidatus Nitrospira neomarina]